MSASAGPGEVLFQRGVDDGDTSMWDDTALVKAYDQAVNAIKLAVNDPSLSASGDRRQKHQKKLKKHKKGKNKQGSIRNWQVGNKCKAVYSEDGYLYEAIITSIDASRGTCVVKYRGYGNEEGHCLKDLMPLANGNISVSNTSDTETDLPLEVDAPDGKWSNESLASSSRSASLQSISSRRSKERSIGNDCRAPSDCNRRRPPFDNKPSDLNDSRIPPFTFPFPMNGMPSMYSGVFGGASASSFPPPPVMPLVPPPMLPDLGSINDEKDALYGMLISWYMSGYHTGYYQCMKQMGKTQKPDFDASSATSNSHPTKEPAESP